MTKEEARKFINENIAFNKKEFDGLKKDMANLMCGLALKHQKKPTEMLTVAVELLKRDIDKAAKEIYEEMEKNGILY